MPKFFLFTIFLLILISPELVVIYIEFALLPTFPNRLFF